MPEPKPSFCSFSKTNSTERELKGLGDRQVALKKLKPSEKRQERINLQITKKKSKQRKKEAKAKRGLNKQTGTGM